VNTLPRPFLPCTALFVASLPCVADQIVRADGTVLTGVEVEQETLASVVYKQGKEKKTLASELVLEVRYERGPKEVEEALVSLQEGDLALALSGLDAYVAGELEKPSERRFPWAPAYAAWKTVEIRTTLADLAGVKSSADRLLASYPESRYVTQAFLAKANAEAELGDAGAAVSTLQGFRGLIETRDLPERWSLECRLALIEVDRTMAGEAKRKELAAIVQEAEASQPTVASRARVVEGETFLREADAMQDAAKARSLRQKAQQTFEKIVRDPTADDATLAGAHTGLGDCLFYLGAEADDSALLRKATLEYLRVITLYENQSRYAPRCYFFAMRAFDLMQDKRRKADMRRELLTLYPGSTWAQEAKKL